MSEMEDIFKSLMGEEKKDEPMSFSELFMLVKTYWDYLWSKKVIIIVSGFLCAVLGLVYAFVRTVDYTASYQFVIEGDGGGKGGLSLSSLLGTSAAGAFTGDNLVELMRSPAMVERSLLKQVPEMEEPMNFIEYYLICDSVRAKCAKLEGEERDEDAPISICEVEFPLGQSRDSFSRAQDSVLMMVASMIGKSFELDKPDKKTSFVYCSYSYKDEQFCKRFLDTFIDEVITYYMETRLSRSNKNIANFQFQADSIKMEWNKAIASKAYYEDGNFNAAKQAVGVEVQRIQMQIMTCSTLYTELMKSIATMKVDQMRETPLIQIIDRPYYPLANNKARKLKFIFIGGVLGGILSVLGLLGYYFYQEKVKPELANLPAVKKDEQE